MSVGCALYPPLFLGGELSINGCEVTATYIGSREGVFGVVRETKFDLNQTELADTFGGKSFYSEWDAQKKSGGGVIQFKFLAPYKPVSTSIHAEKNLEAEIAWLDFNLFLTKSENQTEEVAVLISSYKDLYCAGEAD